MNSTHDEQPEGEWPLGMDAIASPLYTVPEVAQAPQVYTVPEAMKILRMSRSSIYKEINSGRLRSFCQGRSRRISLAAINDYIALREQEAAASASA